MMKLIQDHHLTMNLFLHLAFKIATDPFVGTLTFIRVYSGVLNVGDGVLNTTKSKKRKSWKNGPNAFK